MPNHPPEHHIQQGESQAREKDPHGLGKQGDARADQDPAAAPTSDRQATETAPREDSGKTPAK